MLKILKFNLSFNKSINKVSFISAQCPTDMSCNENNKSLIIKVEYIDNKYINPDSYTMSSRPCAVNYSDVLNEGNLPHLHTLLMEAESAHFTSSQVRSVGGVKFKNELKFSMNIPHENTDDIFNQINELSQSTHCIVITYFGDAQTFVYAPQNCMLFSFEQSEGKYECSIVIENLTEAQPLITSVSF